MFAALAGNSVADVVAGSPEGFYTTLGMFAGTSLPLIPLTVAMLSKKPINGVTSRILVGTSFLFLGVSFASAFFSPFEFKEEGSKENHEHHIHHNISIKEMKIKEEGEK